MVGAEHDVEPVVDLRNRRGAGLVLAPFLLLVAAGIAVASVYGAAARDWTALLLLPLLAGPIAWAAIALLRTGLTADEDGITVHRTLGTTRVDWSAITDVYLEHRRDEPTGIVALTPDHRAVPLTPAAMLDLTTFTPSEVVDAHRQLAAAIDRRRDTEPADDHDPASGGPPTPPPAPPAVPSGAPVPDDEPASRPVIAYRSPGWVRFIVRLGLFVVFMTGVTIWSATRTDLVNALIITSIIAVPALVRVGRDAHPGAVMLGADDTGITWLLRGEHAVPWSDVVAVAPVGDRSPALMLFTREREAHTLPVPRGLDAEQVADTVNARRPHVPLARSK
jgi:hypothetical protein